MSDFFETDDVVKEYDSKIAARILSYLKPYKALIVATSVSLLLSTLGELFVPILQQKVIDEAIVTRFYPVNLGTASDLLSLETAHPEMGNESKAALSQWRESKRSIEVKPETNGGRIFIPHERSTRISEAAERELRERGLLDAGDWYAFRFMPLSPAEQVIKDHPEIFASADYSAAVLKNDLYALPVKEISAIRSNDISFIIHMVVILLLILCLVFLFTYIQTWGTILIGQRVMKDIRLELFKNTSSQSTAFLSRHPIGRIVTRLTGDVETIDEFFSSVLISFLKDISLMI